MTSIVYIVLCLIWGSTWLAIKFGLTDLPPFTAAAARFALALVILYAIVAWRKSSLGANWRDRWQIAYSGLFMYSGSYAFVYLAEQRIDSSLTAILFGSFPFFVALFRRLDGERDSLTARGWVGMIVGFIGLLVVTIHSIGESRDLFTGTLLTILASMASAYGVVLHRRTAIHVSHESAALLQMLVGALVIGALALLFERETAIVWTQAAILSVLYLAVIGTVVAFLGYYWLMNRVSAVAVSTIAFVTPFVATLIGITLGNEQLSITVLLGGLLILVGVGMVVIRKKARISSSLE